LITEWFALSQIGSTYSNSSRRKK